MPPTAAPSAVLSGSREPASGVRSNLAPLEDQADTQAWRVVFQLQIGIVQFCYGCDERQPQSAARFASAFVEPHEALQHRLAICGRNTGAAVSDRELHGAVRRLDGEL